MKSILICPSERPAVPFLGTTAPLGNIPMMGQSLLKYWLTSLACARAKEVMVLAHDRTAEVDALVCGGLKWGLKAKVIPTVRELTPAEAQAEFGPEWGVNVLDHFPGSPDKPLFKSYRDWVTALQAWMPHARMPDRTSVHEVQPNVWVGRRVSISRKAELRAPCWIGNHVHVGPRVVIGPGSILESGVHVESDTQIMNSVVGPQTFVGRYFQIKDSLAWGDTLINWKTDAKTQVADAFMLCSLRKPQTEKKRVRRLDRISDLWTNFGEVEPVRK